MRIVSIGTATADIYLRSRSFKILKDPHFTFKKGFPEKLAECFPFGAKLEVEQVDYELGGGGLNTAATFKKNNLDQLAVVKLGRDFFGRFIQDQISAKKIKTDLKHSRALSSFSVVLLSTGGERTILVYRSPADVFKLADLPVARPGDYFYIGPGATPLTVWSKYLLKLKKAGTVVAINPSAPFLKSKQAWAILNLTDLIFLNQEEAEMLIGQKLDERQLIKRLRQRLIRPQIIVLTLAERGVIAADQEKIYSSPGFKISRPADKTGAGDAFASAFYSSYIRTESAVESIRRGCANAASVIQIPGAQNGILSLNDYKKPTWQKIKILS